MNKTKGSLITSVIALLLCFSLLLGSTLAWFTDVALSGGNTVETGTLDVEMYWSDTLLAADSDEWQNADGVPIFTHDNWEPGYTDVKYVKVENAGTLSLRWRLSIEAEGSVSDLADVIDVYYINPVTEAVDSLSDMTSAGSVAEVLDTEAYTDGVILPYGEVSAEYAVGETILAIALNMRGDAGNEYQDRSIGAGLSISLIATQFNYETDSFDKDYDSEAEWPENVIITGNSASSAVTKDDDGRLTGAVDMESEDEKISAALPEGVKLEDGAESVTLSVSDVEKSQANISLAETEASLSINVHIFGVAEDNDVVMTIGIKELLPIGLNMGNYRFYHVENGKTVEMSLLEGGSTPAHNNYEYDPATGDVTLYLKSFSEVALVADTEPEWKGEYDDSWYNVDATEFEIANADQLASFSAIVGGMKFTVAGEEKQHEADSFSGKTIKLVADINLGDKESENNPNLIFYPIGYYNSDGTYKKDTASATEALVSGLRNFEGTFDGNGNTISNFYHNTWEMKGDHDWYDPIKEQYYRDGMGLFGRVYGGTVKNLTVDNFSSDGEIATTGVIAAYADGATFENIAITNCNPRVYNIGNGGIVGCVGWYAKEAELKTTFKNITVDNSNKITALWGTYDAACGGIVGQYYPTSGQSSLGNPKNAGIDLVNCHVAAQLDVFNDVCGNYMYYQYRYAGMIIGSIRENTTDENGKTIPDMTGISATGCTVNYGTWNDYYYCEFVKNGHPSYAGPDDYKFSRISHSDINFTDSNGNGIIDTEEERASITGCKHDHSAVEDNRAIYLPFHQLFTGYGWGVSSIGLKAYSGIVTNLDIKEGNQEGSVEKFESKFTGDFLYRVGNGNAVSLGSLFAAKSGVTINNSGVWVTIEPVNISAPAGGIFTFNPSTTEWTNATIQFTGTGLVKVTIQDYNFCKPTELYLEVVDAMNATTATNATGYNVVLLNDIGSGFTVSGRYTVFGNGFTLNYTGNGQYLNNGLKQGIVTVSENGTLDNLRIKASIYPASYVYYEEAKSGPSTTEGDRTRYHYQLSAVAASGNATISNCYIYGARNNIFIGTGDVTVKDTILECGVLANVQIQSDSNSTVTFENLTTIQYQVNPTIGDKSKVMLGAGIIVGPETTTNPHIVLNGSLKQYNWVTSDDANAVSNETGKAIINAAVNSTNYNHNIDGKTASNLGIVYMNEYAISVENNTGLPYEEGSVSMRISGITVNGKVYSLQDATEGQIYTDYVNADITTVNGLYTPQYNYTEDLGGQYIENVEGCDEYLYREGDTIYVMFLAGGSKEIDLGALVDIIKYTGQDLGLVISCKDENGNEVAITDGKITLNSAGEYTVTYTVTDSLFYNQDGEAVTDSKTYSWDMTISVSLKDDTVPDAYYEFDSNSQKMGYYVKSSFLSTSVYQYIPFLAGLHIYDYKGQEAYLRFDGDNDFSKVAKIEVTNKYSGNDALIKVTLTDGGVIELQLCARADSGGGSTYTGSIKTKNNVIYFVNDGTTSEKDATTTAAYWYVDYYKFTGNNGVTVTSPQQTFKSSGSSVSTPSGSFSTTINYTIIYDANGGDCGQSTGYATSVSASVTLPTATRSGYAFVGWYTAASGGTRVGGAGDSYTPTTDITLYAQWGKPSTVTYDANGGSCDTESEQFNGKSLILPEATRDGYTFLGWYTEASGGERVGGAGDSYTPTVDITLYAQWQEPITVTYNANGGTVGTSNELYDGDLTLPTPTRVGYTFLGWHTAASGGTKVGDAGASYTPTADITLYAQWEKTAYTITVTTSNATVTGVTNGQQAYYGDTITFTVTYSKNDDRTTTVKDANGNTVTTTGSYTFTMPASNVTISASSSECITPDTLITLADGTQVRVDSLTGNEELLVWNMETGMLDKAPIMFVDSEEEAEYEIVHLYFSDGTDVKIIYEHGFWDYDLNKYVYLDRYAEKYIGHTFAKQNGDSLEKVTLVDVVIEKEVTTAWSPVTVGHLCYFVNGMLSMPGGVGGLFNIFEVDPETMTYDYEQLEKDIETYGLYTYEELNALCPLSEEMFNAAGGAYLKISIGKGNLTEEELFSMIKRYSKFFD